MLKSEIIVTLKWVLGFVEDMARRVSNPFSPSGGTMLNYQIQFEWCELSTMTINSTGWWKPLWLWIQSFKTLLIEIYLKKSNHQQHSFCMKAYFALMGLRGEKKKEVKEQYDFESNLERRMLFISGPLNQEASF